LALREKDQSKQIRDEVLLRMLKTPPQPKTADKSIEKNGKHNTSERMPPKPLNKL
jgi:hypothetical protein